VVEGTAKMIILSPGGTVDSFKVKAGEIVFIPPGYLHYLESVDAEKQLILSYSLGMNDQKT
jgi:oxalate decarboxylase/phosphoglucose isomerase-like protein (cupin superfamily)